nr:hypothetical protein [Embleya scabrispora]
MTTQPNVVVVHNAGHMILGPAEAFDVVQPAEVYERQRAVHAAGEPCSAAADARPRATPPS